MVSNRPRSSILRLDASDTATAHGFALAHMGLDKSSAHKQTHTEQCHADSHNQQYYNKQFEHTYIYK